MCVCAGVCSDVGPCLLLHDWVSLLFTSVYSRLGGLTASWDSSALLVLSFPFLSYLLYTLLLLSTFSIYVGHGSHLLYFLSASQANLFWPQPPTVTARINFRCFLPSCDLLNAVVIKFCFVLWFECF